MESEKYQVTRKKYHNSSKAELEQLSKEELIERVLRLEAHNLQLKNIINKAHGTEVSNKQLRKGREFDFTKCHNRRILLRIAYFGWDYNGLATQEDSARTIEHQLFGALTTSKLVESRQACGYHRCGRTDKGVSSFGQVISLTIRSKLPPEQQHNTLEELNYCKILNRLLPDDIRAVCWMPIPSDRPEFSARFDCKRRSYRYYLPRGSLDVVAMATACRHLVGCHDYRNLCKMDVGNGVTEFKREITACDIVDVGGTEPTSMLCLRIAGNAFLWHQIRCIVGVLLLVGEGREGPDVVRWLLDVDNNPRKPQYNMALDLPLNLFECEYDTSQDWSWDEDELRTVIVGFQAAWTKYSIKATMISDCLDQLENRYSIMRGERDRITCHTDCLLEGVRPREYRPLMQRATCSSLEERIEHFAKKRKIERTTTSDQ